ncbi:MAG TPA: hypothetical protein VLB68_12040, partial [Pyrinomonadaceae bacterium]|nr:hypothetical protein [Pyrinomonadaceae bacterium]
TCFSSVVHISFNLTHLAHDDVWRDTTCFSSVVTQFQPNRPIQTSCAEVAVRLKLMDHAAKAGGVWRLSVRGAG